MLATERGTLTNSLWRELLDYLPVPALLFRIEENDHARLMFANREIESVLGYTPGEYVLESESDGRVQQELSSLVDRIAELSHPHSEKGLQNSELTGKFGMSVTFGFSYRIFRSKSASNHFIVVTLDAAARTEGSRLQQGGAGVLDSEFIAESEVMQGAMSKAGFIATQPVHGWVMGEAGTGRTTVARRIARMIAARTGDTTEVHFHGSSPADLAGREPSPGVRMAVIVLDDANGLSLSDFDAVNKRIGEWAARGIVVKVIVTAFETPERMHASGQLPDSWIYGMTFNTVLLPPLRQRGGDIRKIASAYTRKVSEVLGVRELLWDVAAEEQLGRHTWPGNITELQVRLARALLSGTGRAIRLSFGDEKKRPVDDPKEAFQIVPFEEMTARYLRQVLEHTNGRIYGRDGAAALLGLKPTTLQSKLLKLGIR
jgi:transcriptional regulator of acetoin/glycerol metabolism